MKIMVWIAVLGLIAFPVLAVEMEKPSPEGLRIAADSARRGLTWLALSGGAVMAAEGGTKVKGNTILFHAPNGQLESIRLSDVDVTATKRLNTAVREGRWVDADTLAWANHSRTASSSSVSRMAMARKDGAYLLPAKAPFSSCTHIAITARSKRGSAIPGIASRNLPDSRNGA